MNIIKKIIKCILLFIISSFLILPFISNNKVNASQRNNYETNIGNIQNVDDEGS